MDFLSFVISFLFAQFARFGGKALSNLDIFIAQAKPSRLLVLIRPVLMALDLEMCAILNLFVMTSTKRQKSALCFAN